MRTKKEILEGFSNNDLNTDWRESLVEVLVDIRDILNGRRIKIDEEK